MVTMIRNLPKEFLMIREDGLKDGVGECRLVTSRVVKNN